MDIENRIIGMIFKNEKIIINSNNKHKKVLKSLYFGIIFAILVSTLLFTSYYASATSITLSDKNSCIALGGTWHSHSKCFVNNLTINSGNSVQINHGVTLVIFGKLIIQQGGTITNSGIIKNYGTLSNFGTINANSATLHSTTSVSSSASNSDGTIGNFGKILGTGTFPVSSTILNNPQSLYLISKDKAIGIAINAGNYPQKFPDNPMIDAKLLHVITNKFAFAVDENTLNDIPPYCPPQGPCTLPHEIHDIQVGKYVWVIQAVGKSNMPINPAWGYVIDATTGKVLQNIS